MRQGFVTRLTPQGWKVKFSRETITGNRLIWESGAWRTSALALEEFIRWYEGQAA